MLVCLLSPLAAALARGEHPGAAVRPRITRAVPGVGPSGLPVFPTVAGGCLSRGGHRVESHHAQLGLLVRGEQLFPALLPTWQGVIPPRFVAEPGAVVVGAGGASARCARVGRRPASDSSAQYRGGVAELAGDSGT